MPTFIELGERIGKLLEEKNAAYGNSFDDAGDFLKLLYPNGVQPEQMNDMLCMARIFDKMKRIATNKDAFGESPYQDIAGYAILGLRRVEAEKEKQPPTVINIQQSFGPYGPIGPTINPNTPWSNPTIIIPVPTMLPIQEPIDLTPKIICNSPNITNEFPNFCCSEAIDSSVFPPICKHSNEENKNNRYEDTADQRDHLVERRTTSSTKNGTKRA
jgi:hypothetical protein